MLSSLLQKPAVRLVGGIAYFAVPIVVGSLLGRTLGQSAAADISQSYANLPKPRVQQQRFFSTRKEEQPLAPITKNSENVSKFR